jgi:hypothetical protein
VVLRKPAAAVRVQAVIARLRELIDALDRRTPRPERSSESQIASESAALRDQALDRIARLQTPRN